MDQPRVTWCLYGARIRRKRGTSVTKRSPGADQRSPGGNQLIVSYMFLRQTVGWIGTLLPWVLLVGLAISSTAGRPEPVPAIQ